MGGSARWRARRADLHHGRLQLAVAPRLDRGGPPGAAGARSIRARLAGLERARAGRLARFLPRGASGPGGDPGLHLDARDAAAAHPAQGDTRPDRLGDGGRRPARTLAAKLVGDEGGPDVDIGLDPYGSDHRAVASTFASPRRARPRSSAPSRASSRAASASASAIRARAATRAGRSRSCAAASRSRRCRSTMPRTTSRPTSARARCAPAPTAPRSSRATEASRRATASGSRRRAPALGPGHAGELRPWRADRAALRWRARQQARLDRHLPGRR